MTVEGVVCFRAAQLLFDAAAVRNTTSALSSNTCPGRAPNQLVALGVDARGGSGLADSEQPR
eukprot:9211120-Alexandrium_andersonii.AAC.1